jgi:hypothetical protein
LERVVRDQRAVVEAALDPSSSIRGDETVREA